ncbi:MAG: ATP-binding protein [Candidatus Sulfotelmatobacter sp.]
MTETWKPVKLAAKVIGHISQGMYRTPAGAVKELISNAYDAGATYAKIHTGFPRFDFFSCEDDGSGISRTKFIDLMNGGIGDSEKQTANQRLGKNGRPVIGRLGVGLLSLAQICPRFSILSSHPSTETAFKAEIKFPPYSRQEIDRIVSEQERGVNTKPIEHGEYKITDLPYEPGKCGITVTTSDLRDSFRKTMSNLRNLAHRKFFDSNESYPSFDRYLEAIANPKLSSLYFASQYDQFLFGLALAAPLPYIDPTIREEGLETILTRIPEIAKLQKILISYDFRVECDNIELRRPVIFPSNKDGTKASDCVVPAQSDGDHFHLIDGVKEEDVQIRRYDIKVKGSDATLKLYWFRYNKNVNGYPLKFTGYIFLQTSRLFPKEYQGILVRLRNVAIGQYDVNVMTYPQAEGPRFSMLSAEVFVEEGLDDALKVDRDGFNTLDPQYIRLQAFVHSILHELIFPGSWGEEKLRNERRRQDREQKVSVKFENSLKKATESAITNVQIVPRSASRSAKTPVEVDKRTKAVNIYESNPTAKSMLRRRKFRGVASRIIAAFEAANLEKTAEARREVFYKLLGEIFNE